MYPDDFVDIVRKEAYPIDSDRGVEYERARVRACLEAVAGFKRGRDAHGVAPRDARDEAERVVKVAISSVFGG